MEKPPSPSPFEGLKDDVTDNSSRASSVSGARLSNLRSYSKYLISKAEGLSTARTLIDHNSCKAYLCVKPSTPSHSAGRLPDNPRKKRSPVDYLCANCHYLVVFVTCRSARIIQGASQTVYRPRNVLPSHTAQQAAAAPAPPGAIRSSLNEVTNLCQTDSDHA